MSAAVATYTEAKKASNQKWDAANLDRLSLAIPKGQKEAIKDHAAAKGESVNGFIWRAIQEAMERDKAAAAPQQPQESPEEAPTEDQEKKPNAAPSITAKIGRVADSMAVLESVVLLLSSLGESQDSIDPIHISYVFGFIHDEVSKARNELYRLIEEAPQ